jgi:hypothetical protein
MSVAGFASLGGCDASTRTQARPPRRVRVGVLDSGIEAARSEEWEPFRTELRQRRWIEGREPRVGRRQIVARS